LALGGVARADDGAKLSTARDHYQRGVQLYDLQRYDEAAQEYEAAYQLKPDPALLFNIGQANKLAKHWDKAEGAFSAYLRNVPRAPNRARVEEMVAEIQVAAAHDKRLAEEKARLETEQRAAEERRFNEGLERQRQIAEAQARAEEARARHSKMDARAAARARTLKLAGIGVAAAGGALLVVGGGVLGAASAIASRYDAAPVDTAFDPSDESRWRAERSTGIALLVVGGAAAVTGTASAVIGARRQRVYGVLRWPLVQGASFARASEW
jgi:tetratricopeptide (TPR) repeat protein